MGSQARTDVPQGASHDDCERRVKAMQGVSEHADYSRKEDKMNLNEAAGFVFRNYIIKGDDESVGMALKVHNEYVSNIDGLGHPLIATQRRLADITRECSRLKMEHFGTTREIHEAVILPFRRK